VGILLSIRAIRGKFSILSLVDRHLRSWLAHFNLRAHLLDLSGLLINSFTEGSSEGFREQAKKTMIRIEPILFVSFCESDYFGPGTVC